MYLTKHPAVKNKICLCLSKLYISKIGKKLWLKCTSSKLDSDYQANCKVENSLWRLTRNLRKDYEIKITQHAKSNPKIFWRYINSQLKVRLTINSLKKPDGTDTQDSSEIADVFIEYFSSVFTLSENNAVPQFHLDHEVSPITDININVDIVYNKLISLKKQTNPLA